MEAQNEEGGLERQAERKMRAVEEEDRKSAVRNDLLMQERIAAGLKQRQVVVEAHNVRQHNETQNATTVLIATFLNGTDEAQPFLCDNGAIEAPIAPPPSSLPPPPPPPVTQPSHQHKQQFIRQWIPTTVYCNMLRCLLHMEYITHLRSSQITFD